MDRASELLEIYEASGLKRLVETVRAPFPDRKGTYWKLRFVLTKDNPVSLIELWDQRAASFFRIHYQPTVPRWLPESLHSWPNVRKVEEHGTNFNGDPLVPATALAQLLRSKC